MFSLGAEGHVNSKVHSDPGVGLCCPPSLVLFRTRDSSWGAVCRQPRWPPRGHLSAVKTCAWPPISSQARASQSPNKRLRKARCSIGMPRLTRTCGRPPALPRATCGMLFSDVCTCAEPRDGRRAFAGAWRVEAPVRCANSSFSSADGSAADWRDFSTAWPYTALRPVGRKSI